MHPILWSGRVGGHAVHVGAYSGMLAIAVAAALVLPVIIAWRRAIPLRRFVPFLLLTAAAVPVGARLLHFALNPEGYEVGHYRLTSLSATGFALYGGLLLAAVVGIVTARFVRLDLWRAADACTPGLALGVVLVRAGCFMAGCCFGRPWDGPWAVEYPVGSPAHLRQLGDGVVGLFDGPKTVHPTQLYEALGSIVVLGLAILLVRSLCLTDGSTLLLWVAGFSLVRWANLERFRLMPSTFEPWPLFYPMLYGGLATLGIVLVIVRSKRAGRTVAGLDREAGHVFERY